MEGVSERLPDDPDLLELHWSLRTLHSHAVEIHRALPGTNRAEYCWHALHRGYTNAVRTHAGVLTTMLRLLGAVFGPTASERAKPGTLPDSQFWLAQRRHWDECQDFLSAMVFPYLPQVSEQLEAVIPRGLAGTPFEGLSQLTSTRRRDSGTGLSNLQEIQAGTASKFESGSNWRRLHGSTCSSARLRAKVPTPFCTACLKATRQKLCQQHAVAEIAVAEATRAEKGSRYLAPVDIVLGDSVPVFCNSKTLH